MHSTFERATRANNLFEGTSGAPLMPQSRDPNVPTWNCSNCKRIGISAQLTKCPNCGAPRD